MIKRVKHVGPIDADIAIVNIHPNQDDLDAGIPFAGTHGNILTSAIRQVGMNRGDFFLTNIYEMKPPGYKVDNLTTIVNKDEELENFKTLMKRVKPKVILLMGEESLYEILGLYNINSHRGSPYPCPFIDNCYIIPTLDLKSVMKEYKLSAHLMFDIMKAFRIANTPNYKPLSRIYRTNPTFNEVIAYLADIIETARVFEFDKSRLNNHNIKVAIDLETNFMSKDNGLEYIKCFGIAISKTDAMCIPIHTKNGSRWTVDEEYQIWTLIRQICSSDNIIKIAQNQSFEMSVLYPWVGEIKPIRDTAIGHHLMYPETPKALQFMTSIYTDMQFYKDDAKNSTWEDNATWLYNCKDCVVTHEINELVEIDLKEVGLYSPFYDTYQVKLANILWKACQTGILINVDRVKEYKNEYEKLLEIAQKNLNEKVGCEVNVNSPVKMKWLLYEKMGMPIQTNKKTKKVTTDEKAIEKLAKMFPNEIFSLILEIRGYRKLLSTYLKEFWDSDGRCRSDMRVFGTVTGRLAAMENYRGTGLNIQNIPGEIKDIFIADDGYYFLRADKSQVESRLVAYLSQDPHMIDCFESGKNIHKLVGSMVFGTVYDLITKASPEYEKGKRLGHSANYIVGPGTFAAVAKVPMAVAKVMLDRYYTMFRLGTWHDEVKERIRVDRTMTTIYKRRRTFFDRWGDRLFKEAVAHEPQSTACDNINMACVRIEERIKSNKMKMHLLLQVHDELVYLVHEDDLNKGAIIMNEELHRPITINNREIILPAEIQYGKDWKNVETYEFK